MGYEMVMGIRESDSPSTFSAKQSKINEIAPLGTMLQTKNGNGMREVNRDSSTEEKVVQGLLGEQTTTTIDLASDPVTTTITPQSPGSYFSIADPSVGVVTKSTTTPLGVYTLNLKAEDAVVGGVVQNGSLSVTKQQVITVGAIV